jgi:tetratricopeptide (TPR) repeat protein
MVLRFTLVLVVLAFKVTEAFAQADAGQLKAQEAAALLAHGSTDQAIVAFGEALADPGLPNDRRASILTDRGVAHARAQQFRLALEDFNHAVQLFPEHAPTYNNRGNVLLSLGLIKEAIRDFDRALILAPSYGAAYNNRAAARMRMAQLDAAIADYSKAIELTPASPAVLNGRGRAHLASGRPYAAIRDFSRALGIDSRLAAAYRNRAEAKTQVELHEEAIEDLSRALAFEPANAEAYLLRGQAYLTAGNAANALKDFTKTVELNPRSPAAYIARGFGLAKAEAYDEALNDFASAIELDNKMATAYAYRAWTYKQMQQPDLGAKDVEHALNLDAGSAEAYWVRGEIAESADHIEQAVVDFRKALTLNPNLREAGQALERLGSSPASDETEVVDAGLDRWRVFQSGRQFVARNEEFPRLKIVLEMLGQGLPRLLEWDVKKPPFKGIAVLRFYAGNVDGPAGPEEAEYSAIVDLQANSVVGVELHRQGKNVANWSWDEGKLTVASADGTTDEFMLRQNKPKDIPLPRRVASDAPQSSAKGGLPFWVPWVQQPPFGSDRPQRQSRKPKTLFDLLFNN